MYQIFRNKIFQIFQKIQVTVDDTSSVIHKQNITAHLNT